MSAPKRQHGRDVAELTKSCLRKRRFANEATARAGAQIECQRGAVRNDAMWIYGCQNCRGWHITNNIKSNRWRVTADLLWDETPDPVREEARDLFSAFVKGDVV